MGILSGVPIAVKDNIAVKNMKMTCSSKMLEDFVPPYQATVTEKILKEDAVILGKTNMDEFAMGATTRTSYFGCTKNPLNTNLVPGGSSGGSAAAVSAHESALAIGTDTGGSTRQPASFCGIVGIKPTYGSISRFGISTMANTFDQAGAMGRDIQDAYLLLKAMEGRDERDASSTGNKSLQKEISFTDEEALSEIKKIKVAIPKIYMEMELEDRVKDDFELAIKTYRDLGAKVEVVEMNSLEYVVPIYHILTNGEISSNMSRFDSLRYGHRAENFDNYEEMFKKSRSEGFGKEVKKRIMIGTHILSLDLAEDYYYKALKVRTMIKREYDEVFKDYDVVLSPTAPLLPFALDSDMSSVQIYQADLFTIPANIIGAPSINVPMPKVDGLSVGMLLTANRYKDDVMIRAALGLERGVK